MEFSSRLKNDLKTQIKSRARTQARTEREIEKGIDAYKRWCVTQREATTRPLYIVAEGDSWYRYIVGRAVVFYLERLLGIEILNLASPGDEVREMMTGRQKRRLERVLGSGPIRRRKFDFFLLSGGGNDLVGQDRFYKWLHNYEKGMTPAEVINRKTLDCALEMVEMNYRIAIEIRNMKSPTTHMLLHGYDLAIPDGRRVCGIGPWMKPGLEQRKVPVRLRRDVVRIFLERFEALLQRIAETSRRTTVVPTQGTLTDDQWANELHPTNPGFNALAGVFFDTIQGLVEGRSSASERGT